MYKRERVDRVGWLLKSGSVEEADMAMCKVSRSSCLRCREGGYCLPLEPDPPTPLKSLGHKTGHHLALAMKDLDTDTSPATPPCAIPESQTVTI